jgi:hypothetical protein
MTFAMIGKRYYVEFPAMSFYLHFVTEKSLDLWLRKVRTFPRVPRIQSTFELLRDELYRSPGKRRAEIP